MNPSAIFVYLFVLATDMMQMYIDIYFWKVYLNVVHEFKADFAGLEGVPRYNINLKRA